MYENPQQPSHPSRIFHREFALAARSSRRVSGARYPTKAALQPLLLEPKDHLNRPVVTLEHSYPIVAAGEFREVLVDSPLRFDAERLSRHMLVFGVTGSGKSQLVTLNMLASLLQDPSRSIVFLGVKREAYDLIEKHCVEQGVELWYFDATDPARSISINPQAHRDETKAREINVRLAQLNDRPHSQDSPFWIQQMIVEMNALHDAGYTSLPAKAAAAALGPAQLLKIFQSRPESPDCKAFADFITGNSNVNAQTAMAQCAGALAPFRIPEVSATMSSNEFEWEKAFSKRRVIYLHCPEAMLGSVRHAYNLVLQTILDSAIDAADSHSTGTNPNSISIVIEDLPAWGAMQDLQNRLLTLRSRSIGVIAICQGLASLRSVYGASADMLVDGFATKICMPGLAQPDAEQFARATGIQLAVPYSEDILQPLPETLLQIPVLSASDIRSPEHRHPRFGRPITILLDETPLQAFVCPFHARPDRNSLESPVAGLGALPPLRRAPLVALKIKIPESSPTPSFTNTSGMGEAEIRKRLESVLSKIGWQATTGSARKWWLAFEAENKSRLPLVLRLAEELAARNATITELFLCFVYSGTENIQANLHYLDFSRLKREEERRKQVSSVKSFKTGEIVPADGAGKYFFAKYVEESFTTPPTAQTIEVAGGDSFPSAPGTNKPCYWMKGLPGSPS